MRTCPIYRTVDKLRESWH